jgi:hypothetical protein
LTEDELLSLYTMASEAISKDLEVDVSNKDNKTPETASETSQTRAEFLSSFTQDENKAIMRKVDRRFLLLIGMMYVIKNVCIRDLLLEFNFQWY